MQVCAHVCTHISMCMPADDAQVHACVCTSAQTCVLEIEMSTVGLTSVRPISAGLTSVGLTSVVLTSLVLTGIGN